MRNVMIDIETLGTGPYSVICSIGAVAFEESIGAQYHAAIDTETCVKHGLELDIRTVLWWMDQGNEARQRAISGNIPLETALKGLRDAFDWENVKVWSNGADFDLVILDNAYKACGLSTPWKYYDKMCYRTLKNLVPYSVYKQMQIKPAIAHDALADATAQAITAVALLEWLHIKDPHRVAA